MGYFGRKKFLSQSHLMSIEVRQRETIHTIEGMWHLIPVLIKDYNNWRLMATSVVVDSFDDATWARANLHNPNFKKPVSVTQNDQPQTKQAGKPEICSLLRLEYNSNLAMAQGSMMNSYQGGVSQSSLGYNQSVLRAKQAQQKLINNGCQ
ncbi:MAG: hypothetical protein ACD_62C00073G0002 [uncultured bacterium]|nr:MAG: hypothetical protein ACD_62C00073G0002 [uncultured bacterium]